MMWTDLSFEEILVEAKRMVDASFDSSNELRFMALRSAVTYLIEALEKLQSSTPKVKTK